MKYINYIHRSNIFLFIHSRCEINIFTNMYADLHIKSKLMNCKHGKEVEYKVSVTTYS
jgi:hypothetical protein